MEKQYPDSREGVLAVLHDEGYTRFEIDSVRMDPEVEGCWLVTTKENASDNSLFAFLCFVGGHPEAPGVEEVTV